MNNYQTELKGHLSKGLAVQQIVAQGKCDANIVVLSEKEKNELIRSTVKPLVF